MLTQQEIFDKVVAHARAQGEKSIDSQGCVYRGLDDTKCFAGALIDDAYMDLEWNSVGCLNSGPSKALVNSGVDMEDLSIRNLVRDLQDIHDQHSDDMWESLFERLVHSYGLDYYPEMEIQNEMAACT